MMRWLRRFFWLGVLAGAGCAGYRLVIRRQSSSTDTPSWPTSAATPPSSPPADAPTASGPANVAHPSARWVAPINGDCPAGYPIKANDSSRIFHVPGGRFYDRTTAERCYASADDAVADGYRPAKA